MWADTFLHAEQQHALLVLLWGASTIVSATVMAVTLAAQHRPSRLLARFAAQLAIWGVLAVVVGGLEWQGIHLRDVASGTRVERLLWLRIGFDVGIVGIGMTLAAAGRLIARRPGVVGAGMAIAMNGLALFAIDVQFASSVSR